MTLLYLGLVLWKNINKMNKENLLIESLSNEFSMEPLPSFDFEVFKSILEGQINYMITHDFHKLASILYRVDVSEAKLRKLLSDHQDEAAASILANLIIDRQMEKIKSKEQFKSQEEIPDEDQW